MIRLSPVHLIFEVLGSRILVRSSLFGRSAGKYRILVPYFLDLWSRGYSSRGSVASLSSLSIQVLIYFGRPVIDQAASLYTSRGGSENII